MAKTTLSPDQIRQTIEEHSPLTDTQRVLALICYDFLSTSTSRCVRWVLVCLLSFAGVPQKLIGMVTGYGERQIRTLKGKPDEELDHPRVSRGAPKKLDEDALQQLAIYLVAHPQATPSELALHLHQTRGGSVHPKTIGRYLSQTGLCAVGPAIQKAYGKKTVHTAWGGWFLLLPTLHSWSGLAAAQTSFAHLENPIAFVLTLLACGIMGIARLFHLEDVWDEGVALFTGRARLLTRQGIYRIFRRLRKAHITQFYEKTRPPICEGEDLWVSLDEHVVARWTKKIHLPGTRHPTRNRPMKADKLFYAYEWVKGILLALVLKDGATKLCHVACAIAKELFERYTPGSLKIILDAGGCSLKALKGLHRLAKKHPITFYVKAVKTPQLKALWYKAIERFGTQQMVHPDDAELPKEQQRLLQVAEVYTALLGCGQEIRTILIYHPKEEREQRRLIVIYTNDGRSSPAEVYAHFGKRQRHELTYRVLTHDLNLDVLPKTYAVHPKDPQKPKRKIKLAFLIAWIKALAFNLIRTWQKEALPEAFHQTTVGTLVRKFLRKNATIELTGEVVRVTLEYFRDQRHLLEYVQSINAQKLKIPWLDDRILQIQLTQPTGTPFFPQ